MAKQRTLRKTVTLEGVGLHTGRAIRLRLRPARPGTGIRLRRVDLDPVVEIPALSRFVVDTRLATVLGRDGVEISTVEHCLAALAGLGVDNALVDVDGPEAPILDGSARPFAEAIARVGLAVQAAPRRVLRVRKPIRVRDGDKYVILRPGRGLVLSYSIDFDGRFPGDQHYLLAVTPDAFRDELAPARTFGFLHEVEYLRSVGKARGGSLENAVVLDGDRVLNPEGLRMPDEFVRHKMLDAVGDLLLAGAPIEGHLVVHKGGHALHDALVKALLSRPDAYEVVEAEPVRPEVRPHPRPVAVPLVAHA